MNGYGTKTQPSPEDVERIERVARTMTDAQLGWAISDCWKAVQMAEELEREGVFVSKSGGYYRDEIALYRLEMRRRAECSYCPSRKIT